MEIIERKGCRVRATRSARTVFGLAMAAGLGLVASMLPVSASAQATTGHIFGQAPAGETVIAVSSNTGMRRHATVDANGRYSLRNMPMSVYTVMLQKDGNAVDTRHNVALMVGRGAEVDFACPNDHCAKPAHG